MYGIAVDFRVPETVGVGVAGMIDSVGPKEYSSLVGFSEAYCIGFKHVKKRFTCRVLLAIEEKDLIAEEKR